MHNIIDALYGATAPPPVAFYGDRVEVVTSTRTVTLQDDRGGGGTTQAYRYDATVYAPHEYLEVVANKAGTAEEIAGELESALDAVQTEITAIQTALSTLTTGHTSTRSSLAYHYASRMKGVNLNSPSDINKVPTAIRADVQHWLDTWQPSWNNTAP